MKFRAYRFMIILLCAVLAGPLSGCGKSDKPSDAYQLGMIEFHRGNYAQAIEHFKEALELEPDRHDILEKLGDAHFAISDHDKAIEYFTRMLERKPDAIRPHLRMAEVYLILGKAQRQSDRAAHFYLQAEQQCRIVLEKDSNHSDASLMLARVLDARGMRDQAIEEVARAISFAPDLFDAYMLKAELLRQNDLPDEAEEVCRQAEELVEKRHQAALEAAGTQEERAEADDRAQREMFHVQRMSAMVTQSRGKNMLAIDAYKRAVELAPNRDEEKLVRAALGELYLIEKQWSDAEEQAARIQEIDQRYIYAYYLRGRVALELALAIPDSESRERADLLARATIELSTLTSSGWAEGLYWLGEAYRYRGGHRDQALAEYSKALAAIEGRNEFLRTRIHLAIADIYWRESRYDEAEQQCDEILKYRPQQAEALMMLSRIYLVTGRTGLARTLLRRVTEMEASASANLMLAQLLLTEGNAQGALDACNRAIGVSDATDPHAFHFRGIIHLTQRRFLDAIADFETVLRRDADYAPAYQELARAYYLNNQVDDAVALLKRYIEAHPARAEGAVFLAEIYERLERTDDALEMYKLALSRDPRYIPAYNVARLHMAAGRIDDAIQTYSELIDAARDSVNVAAQGRINLLLANLIKRNHDAAMNQVDELEKLDLPDKSVFELHRILIHIGAGQYAEARRAVERVKTENRDSRQAIEQLIRNCEDDPGAARRVLPLIAHSVIKRNETRFKAASEHLLEALEIMPENIFLRINLIQIYAQLDDRAALRQHATLLSEQHPRLATPHLYRAGLAEAEGRYDDAIAAYERAAGLDPDTIETKLALSRLYMGRRDFDKVIDLADSVLAGKPENSQALLLKAEAYRLKSEEQPSQEGRPAREQAEAILESLVRREPENSVAQRMLARVKISAGALDTAIRICDTVLQSRAGDTTFHVIKAQALFRKGEIQEAMQVLNEALNVNDTNPEIYISLARIYRSTPQTLPTCLSILSRGIEKIPESLTLKLMLIETLIAMDEHDAAQDQLDAVADSMDANQLALLNAQLNFRKAIRQETIAQKQAILDDTINELAPLAESGNPAVGYQAHMLLGQMQLEGRQDMTTASTHFLRAAALREAQPEPYMALAPIYLQQNLLDQSRGALSKLIDINRDSSSLTRLAIVQQLANDVSAAESTSAAARQLLPANDYRHIAAANIKLQAGKTDEAAAIISEIENADPALVTSYTRMARGIQREASLSPADRVAFVRSFNTGIFYTMSGWHNQALVHYRRALEKVESTFSDPGHARATIFARMYLAAALVNADTTGELFEEAAETYERILAIEPQYADASMRLAQVRELQGKISDAIAAYEAAAQLDEENVDLIARIAALNRSVGNLDETRAYLQKAISLIPETPRNAVKLADYHFRIGESYEQEGRIEEALAEYRESIRIAPRERTTYRAYNNAAWHYATKPAPHLNHALEFALKAKDLAPGVPDVRDTLGWVLYLRGEYNAAKQEIQIAATHKAYRNHGVMQYHYAAVLAKLGDKQRAVRILENLPDWHFSDYHLAEKRAAQQLLAELKGIE